MKIKTFDTAEKKPRIFTDRNEPREAFWNKYNKVKNRMGQSADINVISFYGIGGIGKTRLLKQLMSEMNQQIKNPVYTYFDFYNCRDCRDVLERIKNKLADAYKFDFPMFDLCNYTYSQKLGEKPDSPRAKTIAEKSQILNSVMSLAGGVPRPEIAITAQALSVVDNLVAAFRDPLKKNRKELLELKDMEPEDIAAQLPLYFAKDMLKNIEKLSEPLVIFLDTYESLVNELEQIGNSLQNDLWLRGDDGIIQRIPDVLWVIGGREMLKWQRFDEGWAESLEQHNLGNLSFADSDAFLAQSEMEDAELRKYIFELTGGTPVYLNLCLDQYQLLVEKGIQPKPEMFGKNTDELAESFLRYMGDSQKDIVYLLACLNKWTDELIIKKGADLILGFSLSAYEKTTALSFVSRLDSGEYVFHQTMGGLLVKHIPDIIKQSIADNLIEAYSGILAQQDFCLPEYADALFYTARAGIVSYQSRDDLAVFYGLKLSDKICDFAKTGRFTKSYEIIDMLLSDAEQNRRDRMYATVLAEKALIFSVEGKYNDALDIFETVMPLFTELLGENHDDTLSVKNNMADTLFNLNRKNEALDLHREILKKRIETLDENHPHTLTSMNNVAAALLDTGDAKEALDMFDTVLEKQKQTLEKDAPDILKTMNNKATALFRMRETEKAAALYREILEKSRKVRGEDHSETLTVMNNLAHALSGTNDRKESLKLYGESLEKLKTTLGDTHPHTWAVMRNMATVFIMDKQPEEALKLFRELLEIKKTVLGDENPDTLAAMSDVATLLLETGESDEALKLYDEVLEKRKTVLQENHPDILRAMKDVAYALDKLNRRDEAEATLNEILKKGEAVLEKDHPEMLSTKCALADLLVKNNKSQDAVPIYREAVSKMKTVFEEGDLETLNAMSKMATALIKLREIEQAESLCREIYDIRKKVYGEEHSGTVAIKRTLAMFKQALNIAESKKPVHKNKPKKKKKKKK